MFKKLPILLSILSILTITPDIADAKSRSSGSSRSYSKSSSSSKKSSSGWGSSTKSSNTTPKKQSNGWGSTKKSTEPKKDTKTEPKSSSGWGSTKKSTEPKKDTKTQSTQKIDTKSVKYTKQQETLKNTIGTKPDGKKYNSVNEARTDIQSKLATHKYTTKPEQRPSHVPETVTRNGKSYNVTYNVNTGMYQPYDPVGGTFLTLMAADMMVDAAMIHAYGYRGNDVYGPTHRTTVVHHHDEPSSPLCVIFGVCILGFICFVIIYNIRHKQ